jgi:hypothetical protein
MSEEDRTKSSVARRLRLCVLSFQPHRRGRLAIKPTKIARTVCTREWGFSRAVRRALKRDSARARFALEHQHGGTPAEK